MLCSVHVWNMSDYTSPGCSMSKNVCVCLSLVLGQGQAESMNYWLNNYLIFYSPFSLVPDKSVQVIIESDVLVSSIGYSSALYVTKPELRHMKI